MANEVPAPVALDNDLREQAAQNTLAANPLVGVRLNTTCPFCSCSLMTNDSLCRNM